VTSDQAFPAPHRGAPPPRVSVAVFPAAMFPVRLGAAMGATLGLADTATPGDICRLAPGAQPRTLDLAPGSGPPRTLAPPGPPGSAPAQGRAVRIAAEHRLIAGDGETVTVLALLLDEAEPWLLPLSPLAHGTDYTLIGSRATAGDLPLPDRVAAAFTPGTGIVLADGTPCPVERLTPGLPVLTRDNGPAPLRAVLRARLRAAGDHAPVVIAPGTIGNAAELAVSPDHRILLCRPGGAPEAFVQARHLVDGDRIRRRDAGYVDYLSPVFDRHEVIYAEGFPCESLCLTPSVTDRLPGAMLAQLATHGPAPRHAPRPTPATERAMLASLRR